MIIVKVEVEDSKLFFQARDYVTIWRKLTAFLGTTPEETVAKPGFKMTEINQQQVPAGEICL